MMRLATSLLLAEHKALEVSETPSLVATSLRPLIPLYSQAQAGLHNGEISLQRNMHDPYPCKLAPTLCVVMPLHCLSQAIVFKQEALQEALVNLARNMALRMLLVSCWGLKLFPLHKTHQLLLCAICKTAVLP